jgi:hypothetical protein
MARHRHDLPPARRGWPYVPLSEAWVQDEHSAHSSLNLLPTFSPRTRPGCSSKVPLPSL